MEETMCDAGRRPVVRLFYLVLTAMVTLSMGLKCGGAAPIAGTTTVACIWRMGQRRREV